MVWAFKIQINGTMGCHPCRLGNCLFEYCFQVPANRIGHDYFSAAQLKIMQEAITIVVFCIFSMLYLKEELKWNYILGFALILLAVFFVFKKWN